MNKQKSLNNRSNTMNKQKQQLLGAACICSLTLLSQSVSAAITYNANVTPDVIFGSGNTNGGFTVDTNDGVELGLRGKLRHDATGLPQNTFNSNGDGTYSFAAGVAPTQSFPTAEWSFEWSINSDFDGNGGNLDGLTYVLGIDSDPGAGNSFITFDPIKGVNPGSGTVFWDHSLGNNSTTDATDSIATDATNYATLIGDNNVAQNSWKPHWFIPGFDPTVDGQYDFFLAAIGDSGEVARTDISIIVGAGAPAVPIPAAAWLFGSALLGLGVVKRRKA